jgi:CubicO group peptidase (beta-lactamase class C family)
MRPLKHNKIFCAMAVLTLTASIGCVSEPRSTSISFTRRIDDLFSKWNKPDSPGCALAVVKEGKVIYQHGYGCANLEYGTPITPGSVFNIASVTKQFTAMSVLLLAEQGKLSLDDDIRKHVPEVPDFGKVITLRHLIHHSSGLRNFDDLLVMAGLRTDDAITREHMLDMISHQKELNFSPGDEFLYCNTGYILLAEVVARVSGQSFAEFADAKIFKPLGMTNTHCHDDHQRVVKNRAYSYERDEDKSFKNAFSNVSVVGGGGMYSTVEDLCKWVSNFDLGRVGGARVLEEMHEQGVLNNGQTNRYACGLFIDDYKGMKLVEHGGGWMGYRSDIIRFPNHNIAVVLLANTSEIDPAQLTRQVAEIVLFDTTPQKLTESLEAKSSTHPMTSVSPQNLEAYCGVYDLQSGVFGTITREGNRLYAQSSGGPKVELLPVTESTFLIKEDGSRISFDRDEQGQVNRLIVQRTSKDPNTDKSIHMGRRIVSLDAPLRSEELAQFIGEYSSDELGTTYTILLRNGDLLAKHRRLGDIPLTQTVRDQFLAGGWLQSVAFTFTRDVQNQITGFKMTGVRSRNLRFEKRPETVSPGLSR